ncbi:DUF1330 domain-containing protein [Parasphingopyxis marina]|uniref:DUF1330 domain-containing protein n=1 Tax=Parasphingopyxis marina TaxID=2761622 RepID=A0A842HU23_9SPHN|nr:DUF1330 domain-containing protein [Parasphingopyxis marina]MBC2776576.1 DUF1330 domain-containing protein [Parasphingopyxis marina]
MTAYFDPTPETGRAFVLRGIEGPVTMLNLLRFRETADYSADPDLAPDTPISGAEAYELYIAHTLPHLAASGGEMLFMGDGGPWLIGPVSERWDAAMLIRQASVDAFMGWAKNEAYLYGLGHRTAGIEDSRLLPLVQRTAKRKTDTPAYLTISA